MNKPKKQRILYKEDEHAKAAELEAFLFGTVGEPSVIFNREERAGEEIDAKLVKQASRGGGLLHDSELNGSELFFEDTGGAVSSSSSDDDDDDDEGNGSGDGAGTAGVWMGLSSGGGSEAGAEEDEGDGEEEEREQAGEEEEEEEEAVEASPLGLRAGGEGAGRELGGVSKGGTGHGGVGGSGATGRKAGQRAPAWNDPDDAAGRVDLTASNRLRKLRTSEKQTTMDGSEYNAALRKQHQALNHQTSWARKRPAVAAGDADEDADEDATEAEALLGRAAGLMDRPAGRRLPPGQIETTRLKDANRCQPSEAVVQAARFHPNGHLLLTAGLDKKLRLFQVDGLRNPLMQGLHLDDMPITDAAFAAAAGGSGSGPGGDATAAAAAMDRVVLAGRRPHFYVYDMGAARVERVMGPVGCPLKSLERFAVSPLSASGPHGSESLVAFTGDSGFIPLVSLRSRQWVANLKMSGNVRALAFAPDGRELLSTGDDGVVHVWDLRTRRCRLAFTDVGNIGNASSLALSPNGKFVATGARSGVVNVYRRDEVEATAAHAATSGVAGGVAAAPLLVGHMSVTPARELLNLTTNVDTLVFSPDSQMLAMASRMKRDALRLVHLPSLTVFANWPTGRSPLHYVHCADFSPHCGMLTIGNAKGRALLYRLHHYQQA